MLEGFSGGLIIAFVDLLMVFLVLGGLAAAIVGLQKSLQWFGAANENDKDTINESAMNTVSTPVTPQTIPSASLQHTQIAAIAAAIHEFTSLPAGSFRIVGIKPVKKASAWKIAGRLELMGMDLEHTDRF